MLTCALPAWKSTSAPPFFCTSGKETVENLVISHGQLAPCQENWIKGQQTVSSAGCKVLASNAGFLSASMPSYCRFRPIECCYSQSVSVSIPQDKIRGSAIWWSITQTAHKRPTPISQKNSIVGRSDWLPTNDTYQRRRYYRNEEVSVEYVPNMSRKVCERSPNRPNQGNIARHVNAFRYQFGSNPHECVTCVAVPPHYVVQGLGG